MNALDHEFVIKWAFFDQEEKRETIVLRKFRQKVNTNILNNFWQFDGVKVEKVIDSTTPNHRSTPI